VVRKAKSNRSCVSGNNAVVRDLDLTDARIFKQGFPHDVFTTLRREAPVYWQVFPSDFRGEHDPGFWVLSRYDDVQGDCCIGAEPGWAVRVDG